MNTLVLAPSLDTLAGPGKVASRIGLSADVRAFARDENLFSLATEDHESASCPACWWTRRRFSPRRRSSSSPTLPTDCASRSCATEWGRTSGAII